MKGIIHFILTAVFILSFHTTVLGAGEADGRAIAFPGAEGGGMHTSGGRGGKVIYVTRLDDKDTVGTLRWAVTRKYPRTVLFKVSGVIRHHHSRTERTGRRNLHCRKRGLHRCRQCHHQIPEVQDRRRKPENPPGRRSRLQIPQKYHRGPLFHELEHGRMRLVLRE